MRPKRVMDIVDRGQDTPQPVHLGVVAVELGYDHQDRDQSKRECDRSDKRIGCEIDLFQALPVGANFDERLWQREKLRDEGPNGSTKLSSFRD